MESGPPRPIEVVQPQCSDFVVFTDGSAPQGKADDLRSPWIGGVIFGKDVRPRQFSAPVTEVMMQRWVVRKHQIVMVELFAVVVALRTFAPLVQGKFVLLLIDSEAVLGALVKGYSAREDICELVGVFWDLALELRVSLFPG